MKTRKERKYYVSFHLMNPKERKNEIKMLLSKIKEGKAMFGGVKEAKIEIHNTSLSLVIVTLSLPMLPAILLPLITLDGVVPAPIEPGSLWFLEP